MDLWKQLYKARTATIIEQTWRRYLQPFLAIPLGVSISDGLPAVHGELLQLLNQAIHEQSSIGWDKLLLGIVLIPTILAHQSAPLVTG
jgi:hypothetical protein